MSDKKTIRLLITVWLLIHGSGGYGEELRFRRIDTSMGLPHNTVFCMTQDSYDFMWFGTRFGLCRYDGNDFITYNNSNSALGNHTIRDIVQKNDSLLNIATESGVFQMNIHTSRITPLPVDDAGTSPRVVDLALSGSGALWVASEGNGIYRIAGDSVRHFPYPMTVTGVFCDSRGRIFACAPDAGLFRYDPQTENFEQTDRSGIKPMTMFEDREGDIWIGTQGQGLVRLHGGELSDRTSVHLGSAQNVNIVRSIIERGNTLFIATEGGLVILQKESGATEIHTHRPDSETAIADNALYSLCSDREGGIWIGSYFRGISYLPPIVNRFESFPRKGSVNPVCGYAISSFYEYTDGVIIVTSEDNGFCYFDPQKKTFTPFERRGELSYNNIHDICTDRNDRLWIGTYLHGIDIYDVKKRRFGHIGSSPDGEGIHSNSLLRIFRDKENNLHLGTTLGASVYDAATGKITRQEITRSSVIRDIFQDRNGNIWYASMNRGLFRYNPVNAHWREYSVRTHAIPTDKTVCVRSDNSGNIWIGTEGFGILKYRYETDSFEIFDTDKGLPNNFIFSIECSDDYLWIGTTNGLCRYRPERQEAKVYTKTDGLASPYFNYNASRKTSSGDLYFGTVNGFFRFNPAELKENMHIPRCYITRLTVRDRRREIQRELSNTAVLNGPSGKIVLPHNRNNLQFDFVSLSYAHPTENRYKFYLQGFEQRWNEPTTTHSVEYNNLAPGNYAFMLQASNNDGVWSEEPLVIRIEISKPVWASTGAQIVYGLLAIVFLSGIIFYIQRREKIKHQRDIDKKQKEINDSKINFFTNITHEIKTPLSLLKAPVEILKDSPTLPAGMRHYVDIMDRNLQWLDKLVGELLEFRQLEEKQYLLQVSRVEITALLERVIGYFVPYAQENGVELRFIHPAPSPLFIDADEDALVKAISNLLTNAFKFTRSRILVSLRYCASKNTLRIAVHDNGQGVAPKDLGKILEPFTQLDRSKKFKGVGVGLAFSRSLISLHGGELTVSSRPGSWFVATITLPKDNRPLVEEFSTYSPAHPKSDAEHPSCLPVLDKQTVPELHLQQFGADRQPNGHILVVEDTLDIAETIIDYFKNEYCIGYSNNATDALRYIELYQPDIVVSDIIMPGMNGIELCRRIKSDERTSHTGVILLTAKTSDADRIAGLEVGANAYLNKPFSLKELRLVIANLLHVRGKLMDWVLKGDQGKESLDFAHNDLSPNDRTFIMQVSKVINDNIDNADFTTDDLAAQLGMSKTLVYIKLKKLMNMSASEYLQAIRFKRAQEMIRKGDKTIAEIAYDLGFNDPNYFSRAFKKYFGQTPSQYKAELEKPDKQGKGE